MEDSLNHLRKLLQKILIIGIFILFLYSGPSASRLILNLNLPPMKFYLVAMSLKMVPRSVQIFVLKNVYVNVKKSISLSADKMKAKYDSMLSRLSSIDIGDLVPVVKSELKNSHSKKFTPKSTGPYRVIEKLPKNRFRLHHLMVNLLQKLLLETDSNRSVIDLFGGVF